MGLAEKLLADGERPLVVLRPHVRRLVRPALILLVLAPAAAFTAGAVPSGAARGPVRLVVAALAAFVAVRWVVWPFLLWWNTVYVLTDERFFERGGLVRRTGHDLPLQGVSDVVVAQSFSERLLRSGTLRVLTDGGGEIAVTDVPAIARVQGSLLAVVDDIAQRLRAPRRWAEGTDDAEDPRSVRQEHRDDESWDDENREDEAWDDEAWVDEHWDHDEPVPPPAPDRGEARRREREARRRLAELQGEIRDRARRTPVPDSRLEDDGDDERTRPLATPVDIPGDGPDGDDADGARILPFPPRP